VLTERPALSQDILKAVGLASKRVPEPRRENVIPQGLTVVSADGHMEVTRDIFYESFPPHLKERAPRVWFDRYWRMGDAVAKLDDEERMASLVSSITPAEGFNVAVRNEQLAAEGISKEIVYPQSLFAYVRLPDLEVREMMFRVHNEYFAKLGRENPGFFGVGVCSNYWDSDRIEGAIDQVVELGLRTIMIPMTLKDGKGQEIGLASEHMDRFWSIVVDRGLPVTFHIGETPALTGANAYAINFMHAVSPYRRPLGELIFGGVFDRHPALQIVFAEGNLHWVPGFLQDAEHFVDGMYEALDVKIGRRPTDYWHNNCYATFSVDRLGLELLHYIGADRVMWGSDYPHSESSFGLGWSAMEAVVRHTTEEQARMILGGTAAKLYRI
jgi:predicted TIM-barrel fold metal-dependent hydrolase